jgi:hypothetical protein
MKLLGVIVVGLGVAIPSARLTAQSDPIAKLVGTWVRDSATGPDDRAPPNGETVGFSRVGAMLRLIEKLGPAAHPTPPLDCAIGRAAPKPGAEGSRGCTMSVAGGAVDYFVWHSASGKIVPEERGHLVPSADGRSLRDEFEGYHPDAKTSHHRHVYHRNTP